MKQILKSSFFTCPAPIVAEDLIGKYLVRKYRGKEIALIITETEAYDGPEDKACHGRFGKTERNAAMFGPAGIFYVYFVYGMYWMLNIVTGPEDYPAAVLIRAVARNTDQHGCEHRCTQIIEGPGRITKGLKITGSLSNKKAVKKSGLWFEDRGGGEIKIIKTSRIGVDYAGPVWSKKPYRFLLDKNID